MQRRHPIDLEIDRKDMSTRPRQRRRASKTPAVIFVGEASTITNVLYGQLRRRGWQLVTALLPGEVLRVLSQQPVPLIVCRDGTPCLRSFGLIGEIKQLSPQTHVALVVPSGSLDQERRAREAGVDTYLPFSFALKRLQGLIDDLLCGSARDT
jgi:DNA-binding NtrC family response regulator